ncbi:MAG TPA: hypothetical protein PLI45_03435 [Candidatus Woesebacteria bacterium]|nr:hypothetical protein [Candidatus Woesebacteria bacterium]
MEYNYHNIIHVLIDYWGLTSDNPRLALDIFSSFSPEIVKVMVEKIEPKFRDYHLNFQPDKENYDGYARLIITGDLLKWQDFQAFFEQIIIEILVEVQTQFAIPPCNITIAKNYSILGGLYEVPTNEIEGLLHSDKPKINPPAQTKN